MRDDKAGLSAIRKLDEFYTSLQPEERKIIGLLVSSSVQRAARAQAERDWLMEGEALLELLTPDNAPTLVQEIGTYVPGQAAPVRAEKRPFQ